MPDLVDASAASYPRRAKAPLHLRTAGGEVASAALLAVLTFLRFPAHFRHLRNFGAAGCAAWGRGRARRQDLLPAVLVFRGGGKMETILEQQRRYHEEKERLMDVMAKEMLTKKSTVSGARPRVAPLPPRAGPLRASWGARTPVRCAPVPPPRPCTPEVSAPAPETRAGDLCPREAFPANRRLCPAFTFYYYCCFQLRDQINSDHRTRAMQDVSAPPSPCPQGAVGGKSGAGRGLGSLAHAGYGSERGPRSTL